MILTKSVSRFARNTVDSLTTIRKLKEHGTEVYFEKESIWTFDSKGEMLLTILSSLAQEESRSISENVTWGHRKRMADGKVSIPYSTFIGYDKGEDGNLVVNPEQAKTIKLIFGDFIAGLSCHAIAEKLTGLGIDAKAVNDLIAQNARVAQNQTEYNERYEALVSRYEETERRRDELADRINQIMIRRRKLERFIETVEGLPELYTEFDAGQWAALVDSMTVHAKDRITFTLTCGMEIEE